jgi:hypothetical protein
MQEEGEHWIAGLKQLTCTNGDRVSRRFLAYLMHLERPIASARVFHLRGRAASLSSFHGLGLHAMLTDIEGLPSQFGQTERLETLIFFVAVFYLSGPKSVRHNPQNCQPLVTGN